MPKEEPPKENSRRAPPSLQIPSRRDGDRERENEPSREASDLSTVASLPTALHYSQSGCKSEGDGYISPRSPGLPVTPKVKDRDAAYPTTAQSPQAAAAAAAAGGALATPPSQQSMHASSPCRTGKTTAGASASSSPSSLQSQSGGRV
uniref:Uncharacterized protein n=1 Tax=Chromera velia CCMP2878 TaxID=1169474 RepID=A0A0G4FG82_9ALVE|eukprot:Cvel_16757.t1-p1 / transcript=Cvel_16757.t1 / gene=Cvel_16757 / organism=Chromera_velia_CCMP2878 / gene_product=hypothetical protein / transcript_product=hypothetical protein / location=Cvel_scaffold1306:38295-39353(-) / protein_length=147 / sequence_SO=supercontig / SO=protein_coding / is_pseudo=false